MQKRLERAAACTVVVAFGWCAPAMADDQVLPHVLAAARESKPIVDVRLRSEEVDQEGMSQNATAITLRGRLGFETGKVWSTALLAEAELLWPLEERYNSTVNGKTAFPIVPDPESYEINRLQLANTAIPGTTIVVGRQRIVLDDQRFVGNVAWRQNEQTFDAVRVTNVSIRNVTVDVAYIEQVDRLFGRNSPQGRYEGDNYLANVGYQTPLGRLTGFAYLLDLEESPLDSSETVGVRFAGEHPWRRIKLGYSASWATQQERASNPLDYSVDYRAFELTGNLSAYTAGIGMEVLGGDGARGFATPLGTPHKSQGWADKFPFTPADGLDNRYIKLGYARRQVGKLDSFSATASFHVYEADRGSARYGSETDLQLQGTWGRWTAVLKAADYRASSFATDTRKYWAQVELVL